MSINFPRALEIFQENISLFLYGIGNTLLFALIGTLVGFLIGLLVGGIRAIEINDYDSTPVKAIKNIGRWITILYLGVPWYSNDGSGYVCLLLRKTCDCSGHRFAAGLSYYFNQYRRLYG